MVNQPKLWLTYAWTDNEDGNVDHLVARLRSAGIDVLLDKEQLQAGKRLWSQIDGLVTDPEKTDAWAIYITRNALESEACQEELAYALDRTLRSRGGNFPLIGIFKENLPREIIPSAIATRLYVQLTDANWDSVIASSLLGKPRIKSTDPGPTRHRLVKFGPHFYILASPRLGSWPTGFFAAPAGLFRSVFDKVEDDKRLPFFLTRSVGGTPQTGGIFSIRTGNGKLLGQESDFFMLDGPFDSTTEFAVRLPSYSGRIGFGGLSGNKFLDHAVIEVAVP